MALADWKAMFMPEATDEEAGAKRDDIQKRYNVLPPLVPSAELMRDVYLQDQQAGIREADAAAAKRRREGEADLEDNPLSKWIATQ